MKAAAHAHASEISETLSALGDRLIRSEGTIESQRTAAETAHSDVNARCDAMEFTVTANRDSAIRETAHLQEQIDTAKVRAC